jgi:hypothetical protein
MRVRQQPSHQPTADQQIDFDKATAHVTACEQAYIATRDADPFDKAAEIVAFDALRAAEQAAARVGGV